MGILNNFCRVGTGMVLATWCCIMALQLLYANCVYAVDTAVLSTGSVCCVYTHNTLGTRGNLVDENGVYNSDEDSQYNSKHNLPVINTQPVQYTSVGVGTPVRLAVEVEVQYDNLVYQWYRNNTIVPGTAKLMQGEDKYTLDVPTHTTGTVYYYVVIVNIVDYVNYVSQSNLATVVVGKVEELPIITRNPGSVIRYPKEHSVLEVEASVQSGTLHYQWYQNEKHSNQGGTKLNATGSKLDVVILKPGIFYFYVKITNVYNVNANSIITSQVGIILVKHNPKDDTESPNWDQEKFWDKHEILPYVALGVLSLGFMCFAIALLFSNKNNRRTTG